MTREYIELKYDRFFGTGYWEEQYKKHIVEFAFQCSNDGKPHVSSCTETLELLAMELQKQYANATDKATKQRAANKLYAVRSVLKLVSEQEVV